MSFEVRFKLAEAEDAAQRLARVDGERLGGIAQRAVNAVATRFEDKSRERITQRVNLQPAYVKSKTDLRLADSAVRPRAEITVAGPRRPGAHGLTILGRYGPTQVQGNGAMRRAGPRAGRRNAGVHVEIGRGRPIFEPQWFLLPLRRGAVAGGNGLGVFVRTSDRDKPKHIYGPSPYSLFRQQVQYHEAELAADLERTALDGLKDIL